MKQQTDNVPTIYTEAAETIKTAILQGQYHTVGRILQYRQVRVAKFAKGEMGHWCARKHKQPPQKDTAWTAWIFSQQLKKHA